MSTLRARVSGLVVQEASQQAAGIQRSCRCQAQPQLAHPSLPAWGANTCNMPDPAQGKNGMPQAFMSHLVGNC